MTRAVIALTAALLGVPMLVAVLAAGLLTNLTAALSPGPVAHPDIPAPYQLLYQQAAADCPGLDWTVLAAIGKIESDHGRSPLPGITSGQNTAGAAGPMQLLQPTFAAILTRHQLPPGGAHPPSRYNPHDAIHAAAYDLCDHGAPSHLAAAVFAYNHSDRYVTDVLTQATRYHQIRPPLRTRWPAEQAVVADPSGTGGHVTARTATLYHALTTAGATTEGATCWDPHPQNPDSDHSRGQACDVFFHPDIPADVARGWTLTRFLIADQAVYGVHYVIWQGLIWSTEHPTWTTYQSSIYGCPNPTNLTGCHFDHVHISIY